MLKPSLAILIPLATLGLGQESLDLHLHAHANDVRKYESKISATVAGSKIDVQMTGQTKVLSVADNGDVIFENKALTYKTMVDAEEHDQALPAPTTQKRSADGDLLANSAAQDMNQITEVSLLGRFLLLPTSPSAVGTGWTKKLESSKTTGTTAASLNYTLVGKEQLDNVDVAHVKLDYKLGGGSGTASTDLWVRLSDGWVVKSESKFQDLVIPGLPPGSGTISAKLVEG